MPCRTTVGRDCVVRTSGGVVGGDEGRVLVPRWDVAARVVGPVVPLILAPLIIKVVVHVPRRDHGAIRTGPCAVLPVVVKPGVPSMTMLSHMNRR